MTREHPGQQDIPKIVSKSFTRQVVLLASWVSRFVLLVDFGAGDILVGFSSDEASEQFSSTARNTMLSITGVDLTSVVYRGKFVFTAQIGSPQIVWNVHKISSHGRRPFLKKQDRDRDYKTQDQDEDERQNTECNIEQDFNQQQKPHST